MSKRDEGAFQTITSDNGIEFHDYGHIEARVPGHLETSGTADVFTRQ